MQVCCHRCGAELPGESVRGFCAVCGAPQLILGEMFSGEMAAVGAAGEFEGGGQAPPPPRPSMIRWPAALQAGGMVAVGAALAFVLGSLMPAFSLVSFLLVFGAAGISLTLYRRAVPAAAMSGPIGAQIGLVTGMLVLAALTLVLAGIGVLARFRLHAMGPFDAQWALQLRVLSERAVAGQGTAAGAAELMAMIARPEFRAWSTIATVVLLGALVLGLTTGSGALVGSMGRVGRPKE